MALAISVKDANPVDGATAAACTGPAGSFARAATIAGAPIAATPIAATLGAAAPDVFAALVAAARSTFAIPAADIGVVRMGGGNPGKARGKTPVAREATGECKGSHRQSRQSQQA
ncbi:MULTISPECIES: hypothetical protein [unclassified Ensifer]|uniref:hypothetical protein n=1 Tax=unclassified Ensifer TaxID=2633371 RepID=UPI003F905B1D